MEISGHGWCPRFHPTNLRPKNVARYGIPSSSVAEKRLPIGIFQVIVLIHAPWTTSELEQECLLGAKRAE
jgi:hypothetical protein